MSEVIIETNAGQQVNGKAQQVITCIILNQNNQCLVVKLKSGDMDVSLPVIPMDEITDSEELIKLAAQKFIEQEFGIVVQAKDVNGSQVPHIKKHRTPRAEFSGMGISTFIKDTSTFSRLPEIKGGIYCVTCLYEHGTLKPDKGACWVTFQEAQNCLPSLEPFTKEDFNLVVNPSFVRWGKKGRGPFYQVLSECRPL